MPLRCAVSSFRPSDTARPTSTMSAEEVTPKLAVSVVVHAVCDGLSCSDSWSCTILATALRCPGCGFDTIFRCSACGFNPVRLEASISDATAGPLDLSQASCESVVMSDTSSPGMFSLITPRPNRSRSSRAWSLLIVCEKLKRNGANPSFPLSTHLPGFTPLQTHVLSVSLSSFSLCRHH